MKDINWKTMLGIVTVAVIIMIATVVLFIQDTEKGIDVDSQATQATEDLIENEKEAKKLREKELGAAIPSHEEVQRLLSITTDQMDWERLIQEEYGTKYTEYILYGYLRGTLPRASDSTLLTQVKNALIITALEGEGYHPPVLDLISDKFVAIPPYSSTTDSLVPLDEKLYGGFVQTTELSVDGLENIPRLQLTAIVVPTETFSVKDLEEKLDNLEVTVNGTSVVPYNEKVLEFYKMMGAKEEPGYAKEVKYLPTQHYDYATNKPEEVLIYAGTPVAVTFYHEFPNTNLESVETLQFQIGRAAFDLIRLDTEMYISMKIQ